MFSTVWPISVVQQARLAMAEALGRLADVFHAGMADDTTILALDDAIARSRRLFSFHLFELRVGKGALSSLEGTDLAAAMLRPAVLLGRDSDSPAAMAYREALGDWLSQWAGSMAGQKADRLPPPDLPSLSDMPTGRAAWYGELRRRADELDAAMRSRDGDKEFYGS